MRILAIAAHQDDVEFQCAGTLILLKNLGHKIAIATVNNGSCGSIDTGPEKIAAIRASEARRAAALIDADYFCAGIPDLESVFNNEIRRKVCEIVRGFGPDILITHHPGDYMSDHEIASRLARDATFTATLPNYSTGAAPAAPILPHLPYLYYCLPMEGRDHFGVSIPLEFVIDITGAVDKKTEMLCCHASQREWLRKQHGMDEYVEFMKREAKRLGAICGFEYGEGFIQHRGHAYPRKNILAELLPSKPAG
ncbi:MAG: PIG-L deacetylase family protein [Kiritimatiellia bacterium]|nr:PIG-L deacetylase family protein [Kiritimatiellia bacterium]